TKLKFSEETRLNVYTRLRSDATIDIARAIFDTQNNDGSFTLHTSIINCLDINSKDFTKSLKHFVCSEQLRKCDDSLWITAFTIHYIKIVFAEYEKEWPQVIPLASTWVTKQINNSEVEKELYEACEQYLIERGVNYINTHSQEINVVKLEFDEETKKIIHDGLRSGMTIETARTICGTQSNNGSFTLHSSIIKHLKIEHNKFIYSIKRFVSSQNLKECDDSIWFTAFTICYIRIIIAEHESEWDQVINLASSFITKQINNKEVEKELYGACEQYIIEQGINCLNESKSSIVEKDIVKKSERSVVEEDVDNVSKVVLNVEEDIRKTVYNHLRSFATVDVSRKISSGQNDDGSFVLHSSISDHLRISSAKAAIESLKRFVDKQYLRNCDDTLWYTALTVTYFRIVFIEHENEWRQAVDRASAWITKKINDIETENELYKACEQYLIEQGIEAINNHNKEVAVDVIKIEVSEEMRQTVYSGLRNRSNADNVPAICNSQNNDGSFTLHTLITNNLKIQTIDTSLESMKRFVGSQRLRGSDANIWHTAFTITYIKTVLADHEPEWRQFVDRASSWVTNQIKDTALEKELYSACEQYLIHQGCNALNNPAIKVNRKHRSPVPTVLRSSLYGSDGGILSPKDAYLNSELIVVGAACEANRKFKRSCAEEKTKVDVTQARERIVVYASEEVERLFATNVTHSNKDDVLRRAKRAARFLIDEYYKCDDPGCTCCGKDY
ncbi:467_t:CDS:1, partial [Diversispora eburnea]